MSMPTGTTAGRAGIPRYRSWHGIALFKQGFRPFFLAAGVSAALLLAVWILVLMGWVGLPGAILPPMTWHAHEMIFGTLAAAVAGFLLTAIPNWTGRMPLQGWPLVGLFVLWLAGRVAMAAGELFGANLSAVIDVSFLVVLLSVVVREIVAGRNWRNLPVALAVGLLVTANVVVHLEALGLIETYELGIRAGISVIALLITLIGGRIIPSFTGNWLAKRGVPQRPPSFGRFDGAVLALTAAGLGSWTFVPDHHLSGAVLLAAGIGNGVRFVRWQGWRTLAEPLVWSLHAGYLWVPVGLVLMGLSRFVSTVPVTAGLHALTAGAMGGMILAVMTRATLGHTGRALVANRWTTAIYILGVVAATARVTAALWPAGFDDLLMVAGAAWCGAFGLFTLCYGTILLKR